MVAVSDDRDVLLSDGTIARIGRNIAAPPDAIVIQGAGKTLLPGLIDAHAHTWPGALTTALAFGVTTELEMFGDTARARVWRSEQRAGKSEPPRRHSLRRNARYRGR